MPDLIISTREREVWTKDEKKLIDRVAKLFNARHVRMKLECALPVCPDHAMTLTRDDTSPSGRILRCGHVDRYFATGRHH